MGYDYIKRTYAVTPKIGERVRHTVTNKLGTIQRENRSASHYVQVFFDGGRYPMPCHPTELEYLGRAVPALTSATRQTRVKSEAP